MVLVSDYAAAGFDPNAFWSLTPRLYLAHMAGAGQRLEREAKDAAWLAWHVAALGRTKKLPKFTEFLRPKANPRAQVGWQAQAAMWAAYADRRKARR